MNRAAQDARVSVAAASGQTIDGMRRDIRETDVFREAEQLYEQAHRSDGELVWDIADLQLSPHPSRLLFCGTLAGATDATRICEFDLHSGSTRVLTGGPHADRHARTSPDGRTIAFLSDRDRPSDFQLFFLDPATEAVTPGPRVEGWAESLLWSPDGRRLLLGVAGYGAELSSGQGAYRTDAAPGDAPGWMPHVTGSAASAAQRRTAWILDVETGALRCASQACDTIWEAAWCGDDRLVIVSSGGPEEGSWYGAALSMIDLSTRATTRLYEPVHQIALPTPSPCGGFVAFVEAVASDRGYVAGELRLCTLADATCRVVPTDGVDTTCIEWTADDRLLLAGHRGLETVVARLDLASGRSEALWKSTDLTTAGSYATVLGLRRPDAFAFVCESFFRRPRIVTVEAGSLQAAPSPAIGSAPGDERGDAQAVSWEAPDGLRIEGWLLRPGRAPPTP